MLIRTPQTPSFVTWPSARALQDRGRTEARSHGADVAPLAGAPHPLEIDFGSGVNHLTGNSLNLG